MEASQKPEASLSHGDIGMSMEDRTQSAVVEPKKRLIYCSDGVIEEDELLTEGLYDYVVTLLFNWSLLEDLIDDWDWLDMMTLEGKPDNMSWLKWSVYKTGRGFGHTLAYLESWGETLAKEFGITEPQYQDVIDLHNRIVSF